MPTGCCLLVALESRRADLYVQFFDLTGAALSEPAAVLPDALGAAVAGAAPARPLAVIGDAAIRAAAALAGRSAVAIVADQPPPVTGLLKAALRGWRDGARGGPVAPLYLRPPNVTVTPAGPRHVPGRR
jgi:tRNA threonylcarbamoyladenosine biosynthesis protein TsaB